VGIRGSVVKGSKEMLAYHASDRLGGLVQVPNNLVYTYSLFVQVDISERERETGTFVTRNTSLVQRIASECRPLMLYK
jgi:hypothetical protein